MDIHNIEEIQRTWQNLAGGEHHANHTVIMERLRKKRTVSLLEKLSMRFVIMGILGLVLLPLFGLLMYDMGMTLTLSIIYVVFGLIMGSTSIWTARILRLSNYISLPVTQAIKKIAGVKRNIQRVRIFGWIICIPLVVEIIRESYEIAGIEAVWSGIIGGVIGGAIGVYYEIRTNREIKELQSLFEDTTEPDRSAI